ncbi:MAG TPA: TetR/AcrR family transcriptional regulator [Thermoanaerobaculia bacterium]|nr:TetR/AcrR family transcriptional regulator [Thermoanaerobaculia bacterium]
MTDWSFAVPIPAQPPRKGSRSLDTQVAARLLAAGRKAFSENGLYATRVEEITQLAGIAKGTFYLYFQSKEDLIHAIADEAVQELGLVCRRAAASTASWTERLAAVARAHLDFFRAHPDWMRILHQLRGMLKFQLPEWQALRDSLERHVGELAAILGAPPAPPKLEDGAVGLARVYFGAISGAVSVWVSCEGPGGEHPSPESLVPALVAFATAYTGESTRAWAPEEG